MLEDSLKSLQLNHSSFHFILQFSFTILLGAKLKSLSSQQEQMFLVRKQYMKLKWNNIFKEMLNQYDNDVAFLFSSFHPRRFFQVVIIWILLHTFIEPGILQVSSNWQCVHMMANAWHFFGHFLKSLMPSQLQFSMALHIWLWHILPGFVLTINCLRFLFMEEISEKTALIWLCMNLGQINSVIYLTNNITALLRFRKEVCWHSCTTFSRSFV